jgi:hypothetical protein
MEPLTLEHYAKVLAYVRHYPAEKHDELFRHVGIAPEQWEVLSAQADQELLGAVGKGDMEGMKQFGILHANTLSNLEEKKPEISELDRLITVLFTDEESAELVFSVPPVSGTNVPFVVPDRGPDVSAPSGFAAQSSVVAEGNKEHGFAGNKDPFASSFAKSQTSGFGSDAESSSSFELKAQPFAPSSPSWGNSGAVLPPPPPPQPSGMVPNYEENRGFIAKAPLPPPPLPPPPVPGGAVAPRGERNAASVAPPAAPFPSRLQIPVASPQAIPPGPVSQRGGYPNQDFGEPRSQLPTLAIESNVAYQTHGDHSYQQSELSSEQRMRVPQGAFPHAQGTTAGAMDGYPNAGDLHETYDDEEDDDTDGIERTVVIDDTTQEAKQPPSPTPTQGQGYNQHRGYTSKGTLQYGPSTGHPGYPVHPPHPPNFGGQNNQQKQSVMPATLPLGKVHPAPIPPPAVLPVPPVPSQVTPPPPVPAVRSSSSVVGPPKNERGMRLTLHQYAALTADLQDVRAEHREQYLASFRLDQASYAEEERAWNTLFQTNHHERQNYQDLVTYFRSLRSQR